jgi:phage baseplate assembly protein W
MESKPSVFGRSLQLVDGDLRFDEGDFKGVSGRDNFLQSLQIMIETPFATDMFNVNYGFDLLSIFKSPHNVQLAKELIRLNIVKSVSRDDRVREIKEVVFDDDSRFFEILPDQQADENRRKRKTERRWQAVAVLETIPEGEVAFKLEGAGLRT